MGAGEGARHSSARRRSSGAHRARRRDAGGRAPRDGRRRVRPAGHPRRERAARARSLEKPARLAQRNDRADVFGRGPRQSARASVRCRLVRRDREMAARRGGVGHAAVRHAPRREPRGRGDDDAASVAAAEGHHGRPLDRRDAGRDDRQCGQSRAVVHRRDGAPLFRHRAGPPGTARRDRRRAVGQPLAPRLDRERPRADVPGAAQHRRRGRSAGDGDGELGRVRHRRGRHRPRRPRLCGGGPLAAGPRAACLGARRRARLPRVHGRPRGGRGQPGRRSRDRHPAPDRRGGRGAHRPRDARQVAARRAGGGALRRRARGPCRRSRDAGG